MSFEVFEALVAYAIDSAGDKSLPAFQDQFSNLLKQLQEKEWEDIHWLGSFCEYLDIDREDLPDAIREFVDFYENYEFDELIKESIEIRNDILLEDVEMPTFPIRNITATFTIEWLDGKAVDYVCRPFGLATPTSVQAIANLAKIFTDELIQSLLYPGPDAIYASTAKKFDKDVFVSLMKDLYSLLEEKDIKDRDMCLNIFRRIYHRFYFDNQANPGLNERLEFYAGSGGFESASD